MTDAIATAPDDLRAAIIHAISIAGHTLTTNEVYRVADAVMVPVRERDAAQHAEIERLKEGLRAASGYIARSITKDADQ